MLCGISFIAATAYCAPITVANAGKSVYSIYFDAAAPSSVKVAAEDLQRILRISTGVELPLVNQPKSPMICLGDNAAARDAGITLAEVQPEGFKIVTKGQDLFLLGTDTPDGQRTPMGGFTKGTQYAVSAFLEKFLGVRWLMPGDAGEVIPHHEKVVIPDTNLKEQPGFLMRDLMYVQEFARPEVLRWFERQKGGGPHGGPAMKGQGEPGYRLISAGHSWDEYVSVEDRKRHPEWLAVGGDPGKFCTSNKELVRTFAEGVIKWIDKAPDRLYASISPADGGGFCKCKDCLAMVETDWHGNPSYTVNILKFYNDVAKIVAEKYPKTLLAGLVYYNYTYPPKKPMKMEPTVHLHPAPLDTYGFGLFKPEYQAEYERLMSEWKKISPDITYTNYSTWMRSESGAPIGPGMEILKLELPTLHKLGYSGVMMCGVSAWGYGALTNYLLVRQMWDPMINLEKTAQDWLQTAYGPGWENMTTLYRRLDEGIKRFKIADQKRIYDVTYEVIRDVHLPLLPEMERLYVATLNETQTDSQRQRLEMFGANLRMLHYHLRRAGLLKDFERSPLYLSDAAYEEFFKQRNGSLFFNGGRRGETVVKPIWVAEKRSLTIPRLPADQKLPVADGKIEEAEWKAAAIADQFRLPGSYQPASQPTVARLMFDDRALYIAFECQEANIGNLSANEWPRDDGRVYHGDVVEIFLSFAGNLRQWWHLTVNPKNVQWDGLVNNAKYSFDWKRATAVGEKSWSVEVEIPWKNLRVENVPAGKTWRANLTRENTASNENSSWCSVEENFMNPEHCGEWVFAQ